MNRRCVLVVGGLMLALAGVACERDNGRTRDANARPPVPLQTGDAQKPKPSPEAAAPGDVPPRAEAPRCSDEVLAAVKAGNAALVKTYLENGGSAYALTPNGLSTLLVTANREKQPEVVAVLLRAGANPNLKAVTGVTPLHFAIDADSVKRLLAAGADPEATYESMKQMPLHWGVRSVDSLTAPVELLLKAGASTEVRDWQGLTPLHHAAMLGNYNMCRLLLKYGASRNGGNGTGKTPLDLARQAGHDKIVALLSETEEKPSANSPVNGQAPQ